MNVLVIWDIFPVWSISDEDWEFGVCRTDRSVDVAADWEVVGFEGHGYILFKYKAILFIFCDLEEVSDLVCGHVGVEDCT